MPAEGQAARERARVKKRNASKLPTIDVERNVRPDWEARGKPNANLKAHLHKLYWADAEKRPAQTTPLGTLADIVATEDALDKHGRKHVADNISKAPKLNCESPPLRPICKPHVSARVVSERVANTLYYITISLFLQIRSLN